MELIIRDKLKKQRHLFETYKNKPENMSFRCLIDNLCGRVLTAIEEAGMTPPGRWNSTLRGETARGEIERTSWEPEDE